MSGCVVVGGAGVGEVGGAFGVVLVEGLAWLGVGVCLGFKTESGCSAGTSDARMTVPWIG